MNGLTKTIAAAVTGTFAMTAPLAADTILFGNLDTTIEDGSSGTFDMNNDGLADLLFSLDADGNADVTGVVGFDTARESFTTVQTVGDSTIVDKLGAGDVIGMSKQDIIANMGGPKMVNDIAMVDNFDGDLAMWGESGETGFMSFVTEVINFELDTLDVFYGYLEITRGSIILGQYAVSTGPLTIPGPATMPAVPLPAGFPLLLVGLGALGLAKRRKAKAA